MLAAMELVHSGRAGCVNSHGTKSSATTSTPHDMQNIMHATLHKTRDIFTIFLIHNAEGLCNVSLVL